MIIITSGNEAILKKEEGESQAIFHKNQESSSYAPQSNYSYHSPNYYPVVNNIPQPSYYSSPRPMNNQMQSTNQALPPPQQYTHQLYNPENTRGPRPNQERMQIDPIPVSYTELLPRFIQN